MQSIELVLRWKIFDNSDSSRVRADNNVIYTKSLAQVLLEALFPQIACHLTTIRPRPMELPTTLRESLNVVFQSLQWGHTFITPCKPKCC